MVLWRWSHYVLRKIIVMYCAHEVYVHPLGWQFDSTKAPVSPFGGYHSVVRKFTLYTL